MVNSSGFKFHQKRKRERERGRETKEEEKKRREKKRKGKKSNQALGANNVRKIAEDFLRNAPLHSLFPTRLSSCTLRLFILIVSEVIKTD